MLKSIGTLSILGLVAIVAETGCHPPEGPAAYVPPPSEVALSDAEIAQDKVVVEPATERDMDATLVTSGRVAFEDIKVGHVFSPVSGRVLRIDVQLGERVKKGQTLAVLQSPDISQASSDVAKADADLIAAEHDLQREQDLLDKQATSYKDYETAEDTYRQAKAEKSRALQKAFLLRTGGIDQVTQGFALVAPIDGDVLMRNLSLGAEVQGQYAIASNVAELFTVGDIGEVWVMADVYESDLSRIVVGAAATVSAVAYPGRKFEGKVDWVSGTLDPATRTGKIRCTFENPDKALKPDMYTTVAVAVASHKALALPPTAVLRLGDQTVVFVDRGVRPDGKHHFERLPVAVDDALGGKWLPVLHGLDVGQRVAVQGVEALNARL